MVGKHGQISKSASDSEDTAIRKWKIKDCSVQRYSRAEGENSLYFIRALSLHVKGHNGFDQKKNKLIRRDKKEIKLLNY